ncbi:hypothetical protein NUACC21_53020 [Scytonema sp. NUACC21]
MGIKYVIDHKSGKVLAYVLGTHKYEVFVQTKALLLPFGITRFCTDGWGSIGTLFKPRITLTQSGIRIRRK